MNTTDKLSRNAHPVMQDQIRKALKIIFELQLDILKLDDWLSHLATTAFWVIRLTAEDLRPDEFHRICKQNMVCSCASLPLIRNTSERSAIRGLWPTPPQRSSAPLRRMFAARLADVHEVLREP